MSQPQTADNLEEHLREDLAPDVQLVRSLGEGRMARVYLAREPALKRLVAVKVMLPELARDEVARKRFEREAQTAASINHPNVVGVYRVGRLSNDVPYLLMQYVKGRTLEDRLQAEGPLSEDEVRRIMHAVAGALDAAHAEGVVHRDVKPANILSEKDSGRIFLTDFGIAAILTSGEGGVTQLTKSGEVLGEPEYLSPEQVQSEEVTGHTDVYSLGVSAFQLLTGRLPFEASSSFDMATAHVEEEPARVSDFREDVARPLDELIHRCLAKQPLHRPDAGDVVQRLEALEEDGDGAQDMFSRLKKRKIFQVGTAVTGGGWLAIEVIDTVVGNYGLPGLVFDLSFATWISAIPASLVLAWFHGEKGEQEIRPLEMWLLGVIGLGWLVWSVLAAT